MTQFNLSRALPGDLSHIKTEQREGVLTITLNRPEKRNAMSVELTFEMVRLLEAVAVDESVRVVVLRGEGPGFCAGMDIKDFFDSSERDEATLRAAKEAANHWRVRLLRNLPQPTIAMVHGFCFGGAFGIVEACDIALAADDTKFTLSEINFGHFPAGPVAKAISRTMSVRAASYYSLSGRTFDGPEAERNSFISRSYPAAELEAETYKLAAELATKDPVALQFTKESLQYVETMSWDAALNYNAAKFAELKVRQQGATSRAASVASFLEGKSRPGLGS
ncbi:enoyl-CoA hydratase-related protein [Ottowia caeni]|uniref:enoyl-CoA hydratase-related protein n=1 Tax=Ottowia caeni TaxID=2870339 RepID=UPI001E439B8F|nr:enoyl-CoA hydratase/isomerase family protein [Ottowia caeni]